MCFCFFKLHPSSFYKLVSVFPSTDWLFSKQSFVSPSTGGGSLVFSPAGDGECEWMMRERAGLEPSILVEIISPHGHSFRLSSLV